MEKPNKGLSQWFIRNILARKTSYLLGFALETARWEYLYETYRRKYAIDHSFQFCGSGIILQGTGKIILKDNGYIGRYSIIESGDQSFIEIGKRTKIAPFVSIRGISRDLSNHNIRIHGNITIGEDVWIGTNVYVNPSITIGDRAVIGANSVVTKDIPSDVLACGCPAIVKKQISAIKK